MGSKKPTFSNLVKAQLHHISYFISLFYFLIYFYYFIFIYLFFSQLPKYFHFSFSSSLSLCSRCIFSPSPPSPFFFFFPTTYVPPSLSFFFPFLLLLHKSSVKSLRLLLHPQFRPSSQSDWDPHTCSLGETH